MVLHEKMTVMQVRPAYSTVYQFKPYLKFSDDHVKSKRDFVRFLKSVSENWKEGDYFFRCSQGTFAYVTLDGARINVLRKSPRNGREYLCWQYFASPPETKTTNKKSSKK